VEIGYKQENPATGVCPAVIAVPSRAIGLAGNGGVDMYL